MIELTQSGPTTECEPHESASTLTRRVYDALAPVYTLPTLLFHSKAHELAIAASAIDNGMRVLEVAIGSGEMLRRLIEANPDGQTIGVDLSPKMAARSQEVAARCYPDAVVQCQAADVRSLPFPSGHFEAIVCCYLFELLPESDIAVALRELRRVLQPGAPLTIILIAQNVGYFNAMYRVCSTVAPAFWGRQIDDYVTSVLPELGFSIEGDTHVQQLFYSSRVVSARSARAALAAVSA